MLSAIIQGHYRRIVLLILMYRRLTTEEVITPFCRFEGTDPELKKQSARYQHQAKATD